MYFKRINKRSLKPLVAEIEGSNPTVAIDMERLTEVGKRS